MRKHQIEPSRDFAERTMLKIIGLDEQKKIVSHALTLFLIFSPFLARQIWLFVRHDYFSISGLPFSHTIVSAYGFFLSALAFYLFLAAGVVGAACYLFSAKYAWRKLRLLQYFFGQARFRI